MEFHFIFHALHVLPYCIAYNSSECKKIKFWYIYILKFYSTSSSILDIEHSSGKTVRQQFLYIYIYLYIYMRVVYDVGSIYVNI